MKRLHTRTQTQESHIIKEIYEYQKSYGKRQTIKIYTLKVYTALNLWLYLGVVVVQASFIPL